MPSSTRAVVIGHTGFVGGAVVGRLRDEGGVDVDGRNAATLDMGATDAVERLCDALCGGSVLVVAARSRKPTSEACSADLAMAVHAARCFSRVRLRKCVFFSTLSVYGDAATNLRISEDTDIAPTSPYGFAKFAAECVLRDAAERTHTPLVVLRPCKVYGPGDRSDAYGPAMFIDRLMRDQPIPLYGQGEELRDHVFVDNLADAVVRLSLGDQTGTFVIGSGESHSFRDLITRLERIVGRAARVTPVPRTRPLIDQRLDVAKMRGLVAGVRWTALDDGLRLAAGDCRLLGDSGGIAVA